ncbi:MAG: glycosyltransferase family 39 protein [bacterium]
MSLLQKFILVSTIALFLIVQISAAWGDSQTIDEGTHLASGYSYWINGQIDLNPEHPPLIKLLSSAPLLFLNLNFPSYHPSWQDGNQWEFARQFLYHNTQSDRTLIFLGRLPIIILTALLILIVFIWARKIFGTWPALLSSLMLSLDPVILAHGRLITTDLALGLFYILTIFLFWEYLLKPNKRNFLKFALIFSLAQITKFSALILWPILILLYLIYWWQDNHKTSNQNISLKSFLITFSILLIVSSLIIWLAYGFELKPASELADVQNFYNNLNRNPGMIGYADAVSQIPFWNRVLEPANQPGVIIKALSETFPIPALHYFNGIVELAIHNYYGHGTYLLGQSSNMGWWYYFPVAFLVKTPLSIIILFGLTLLISFLAFFKCLIEISGQKLKNKFEVVNQKLAHAPFWIYLLILPPLIYFVSSLFSHINLGVRHLLPVFPFIYLFIAVAFKNLLIIRFGKIIISFFIAITLLVSLITYPNHMSYFSESVGGSKNGPLYLLDSNLDWGQGFYELRDYLAENNLDNVYGAFFFSGDLSAMNMEFKHLPSTQEVKIYGTPSGIVAISISALFDPNLDYGWLKKYQPVAKLRGSIMVYHLP